MQLASDIIGDLRGILSDIKNEENILRNEQTSLARIMEEALEHSDIGTKDYVFEESLITSLFFRPGWSRPIAKTKLKNAYLETKNTESSMKEKLQSMIPFEGDLSIYHVIWLDRGINNFQPRSSNFMESAYASEENRSGRQ